MDLSDLTWQEGIEIITEGRYAIVAVYALQLYEWLETAPLEVNLIHYSPWSPVKVAYLLCRYYPLVLWPLVMFAYVGNHSWEVCNHLGPPVHILLAPCQLFPQGVMMMRAYAFCGRDKRILVILLMCITGLLAVDIWAFCTHYSTLSELVFLVIGSTGCFPVYGQGYMGFRVGYSMLAATLVDLMSLVMILVHCARKRTREISLARYFIKQGMISFGLVTAVNVTTAVFFFNQGSPNNGLGLPFILVVSNLIACRVILGLRRRVTPTESEIRRQHSRLVREALQTSPSDEWLMESEDELQ